MVDLWKAGRRTSSAPAQAALRASRSTRGPKGEGQGRGEDETVTAEAWRVLFAFGAGKPVRWAPEDTDHAEKVLAELRRIAPAHNWSFVNAGHQKAEEG